MFGTKHRDARGVETQVRAKVRRLTEPACGQHPEQVAVGNERDITSSCNVASNGREDPVGARGNLGC